MLSPLRRPLLAALAVLAIVAALPAQRRAPVKVFVLAGQSNMEGKAQNKLWDYQAVAEATAPLFAHLRDGDGWRVRDDVFIDFLGRHGGLTLGYGSPDRTGVELEFGHVLGEHFDEPVLLIKAAWGGRSLYEPFRPPSAGMPAAEKLAEQLAKQQDNVRKRNEKNDRDDPLPTMADIEANYGVAYRDMLARVREVMAKSGEMFPALQGRRLELAGFVWHQGWNDQYGGAELEYADNLRHLIRDVRKDLDAPKLPVVIAVMGQNGSKPAGGAMQVIQQAQLGVAEDQEFASTVRAVRTDELVDRAAENLFPTWRDDIAAWEKVGSDRPYHYLGSAIWHIRMGHELAAAMLELQQD